MLTLFALMAPVCILFLALSLDVGNWFTHKRQLQNRADAAALAAGVEYLGRLQACLGANGAAKNAASTAITQVAKQYAGDADATVPGPKYNTQIANQGTLDVAVNASGYGGTDGSDGGMPCDAHTAGDWISAAGNTWTDVKVKETNIPTFFGTFGITVPAITARARVEVHPALSDNGFIPIGVPDSMFDRVQARIINQCTGAVVEKIDLAPLTDANQTLAGQGITLWGPTTNVTSPPTPVEPTQAGAFALPEGTTCRGGGADGNGYRPLGVEVRVASKVKTSATQTVPDIDGPTCAALHNAKYTDCWTDLTEIRDWDTGDATKGPPVFQDVHLYNGGPACTFDPYFTRTTACSLVANVKVDWGDRPGVLSDPKVSYTVSLNGVALASSDKQNWSATSGFFGAALPAGGASNVTLTWSWEDKNTSHVFRGQACKNGGNNPCKGSGSMPVQRTFTATEDNVGPIDLVQATTSPVFGAGASLLDSGEGGPGKIVNPYVVVGFHAPYETQTPGSALITLRADTSQGTQSLNCNTSNQGDDFQEFALGCTKFYWKNQFDTSFWWTGQNPYGCPSANTIFAQPNSSTQPWLCVDTAPGATANTVACAVAYRTGNAPNANPNGNNCSPNDLQCVHPNKYTDYQTSGEIDAGDPRIVKVFIVPYGAFKGVNGSTDTVPIQLVGVFYITGWGGSGGKNDPCAGDDPAKSGEIVGRFIKLAEINTGPVDTTALCDPKGVEPCRVSLVR